MSPDGRGVVFLAWTALAVPVIFALVVGVVKLAVEIFSKEQP